MIERAYIEDLGNGRMAPEQADLKAELEKRGIPVQLFTKKLMDRRRLELNPQILVAGGMDVVIKALKYLGHEQLSQNCYPTCLRPFLKRKVWTSSIKSIKDQLYDGHLTKPVFLKPKDEAKKFTGLVLQDASGLYPISNVSRNTPIYCSDVVEWQSEFRVYVIHSEIVGVKYYSGDENLMPDFSVIEAAIRILKDSQEHTAGYGIDFGVLASGETAMVEWNDGFSLGSYDLDPALYCDLIVTRWEELMEQLA